MKKNRGDYLTLYNTLEILPKYKSWLNYYKDEAILNWHHYIQVEKKTNVPWQIIAALHANECAFDLNRQILNGEKWNKKTRKVPKNLGPFESWIESAVFALNYINPHFSNAISIVEVLTFLESWNGWGYRSKGVNSPYLWALTNYGVGVGKFVRDGTYDPKVVSKQLGAAALIKELNKYKTNSIYQFDDENYLKLKSKQFTK